MFFKFIRGHKGQLKCSTCIKAWVVGEFPVFPCVGEGAPHGQSPLVLYEPSEGRVSSGFNGLLYSQPARKLGKRWSAVCQRRGSTPDSPKYTNITQSPLWICRASRRVNKKGEQCKIIIERYQIISNLTMRFGGYLALSVTVKHSFIVIHLM